MANNPQQPNQEPEPRQAQPGRPDQERENIERPDSEEVEEGTDEEQPN
jgi:hypothetical protein